MKERDAGRCRCGAVRFEIESDWPELATVGAGMP